MIALTANYSDHMIWKLTSIFKKPLKGPSLQASNTIWSRWKGAPNHMITLTANHSDHMIGKPTSTFKKPLSSTVTKLSLNTIGSHWNQPCDCFDIQFRDHLIGQKPLKGPMGAGVKGLRIKYRFPDGAATLHIFIQHSLHHQSSTVQELYTCPESRLCLLGTSENPHGGNNGLFFFYNGRKRPDIFIQLPF